MFSVFVLSAHWHILSHCHAGLQVAALLDDYSMVSFVPLDVSDEERSVTSMLLTPAAFQLAAFNVSNRTM